jgi:GNAT superfamily N-acetyltransferase
MSVRIDSWRTTYRGMIPDAYLDGMTVEASTAIWDRVLTAGANTTSVFVAEHAGEIIGLASGTMLKEPKHDLDAELVAIYLRREFQRVGLGHRLVGEVVDAQRAHGATGLLTWVIAGARILRTIGRKLLVEQPYVGRHGSGRSRLWLARPRAAGRRGRRRGNALNTPSRIAKRARFSPGRHA